VVDLRTAISKARKEGITVRRDGVQFKHEGKPAAARLEVQPLARRNGKKQDLLVVFQKMEPASPAESLNEGGKKGAPKRPAEKAEKLERELASTREQLRTLISEHEVAQEEMKAANEEILSSNEELQSTNEEMETAKEELQSANEELVTLNDELQHRNDELTVLTHDLGNLLAGVDIPVLVLDAELRVRRFTPMAGALLNLIPGDVGRPFSDIASNLDVGDWDELLAEVTRHGRLIEREVQDRKGHRYSMRVRPYKAGDHKIEGVLVVMLDTDLIYRARDDARKSGEYSRAIVDTVKEALVVVDSEYRVLSVNESFSRLFGVPLHGREGQSFFGRGPGQCDAAQLRDLLQDVLSKDAVVENFEVNQAFFAGIGRRRLVVNARQIDNSRTILVAIQDITDRERAHEESEKRATTIRALLESTPQSVIAVSADEKIVLVNGNTETMFGYKRQELLGQRLDTLVPDGLRALHADHHKDYFANMQTRPMGIGLDLEGRRKDGTTFPVEIGLSAIETAGGKLAVAFVSDITQRRQMEQSAQLHAQGVQALAARLLTVQEEERRKVSRDLHDQICQQLASLAIDIGTFAAAPQPPDRESRLREFQARVVKASEETRHIAYELHPSMLDDLGLVASLGALCKEFAEQNPDIGIEFDSGFMPASLSLEVASGVFRVAQESLQNVAKHSRAKHVSVSLGIENGALLLTVADDGAGFDLEAVKGRGGLGLIGAEERARLLHGTVTIRTQPDHGTQIALQIPLPPGSL
jgi:PAS domain S-box-containing protein